MICVANDKELSLGHAAGHWRSDLAETGLSFGRVPCRGRRRSALILAGQRRLAARAGLAHRVQPLHPKELCFWERPRDATRRLEPSRARKAFVSSVLLSVR